MLPNNIMTLNEAQAFFELLMVNDPWPISEHWYEILTDFADETARAHGFDNWVDAYHCFESPKLFR